jgi:cullin-associated NEDD8-dissociated protein 1
METVFSRTNRIDFFDRVVAGLQDDNDIRSLCNLMLSKLAVMDPDETLRRLDSIATAYRAVLSTKLKEGSVKQDVEKQAETTKGVIRVSLLLNEKIVAGDAHGRAGGNTAWRMYWELVNTEFALQVKALREESREQQR